MLLLRQRRLLLQMFQQRLERKKQLWQQAESWA
jgi:hypothetical protein